jgi:cytochrome bd-type quinol oxidase subunit 1
LTLYLLLYAVLLPAYVSVLFYLARKGTPARDDTPPHNPNTKEVLSHA